MLQLGCWDWRQGKFEQVNNYKAVVGSLKELDGSKYISMIFFVFLRLFRTKMKKKEIKKSSL